MTEWKLFDRAIYVQEDSEVTIVGFKQFAGIDFIQAQFLDGKYTGQYGLFLEDELEKPE